MNHPRFAVCICVTLSLLLPAALAAQQPARPPGGPPPGWSSFIRGGAVYQFDTDLDEGGSYSTTRFTLQGGPAYNWDRRTSLALALGYSYNGYSFSGDAGIAARDPWDDIHSVTLGVPFRFGIDDAWSTFLIPSIRSSGENGASFGDTLSGSVLTGFAYRFGDRLTIGPGIGIVSQLEDSATIFPILIIDWRITDRLSLETGRGLGATLGPGLTLNYQAGEQWRFSIGGRYEELRFRLDEDGAVPSGIGEDAAFPLFAGVSYQYGPKVRMNIVGGVELGGELRLEDENGNLLSEETYDPGVFFGLTFAVRL